MLLLSCFGSSHVEILKIKHSNKGLQHRVRRPHEALTLLMYSVLTIVTGYGFATACRNFVKLKIFRHDPEGSRMLDIAGLESTAYDRKRTRQSMTSYFSFVMKSTKRKFEVILTVHHRYYVEIKYQLDATDDIYCRFYCMLNMFRDNTMPIIRSSRVLYRWSLPVVFGALVFRLSVWCGAEGYVSGLQAAALVKQQPANRTHNLQLHIIQTT